MVFCFVKSPAAGDLPPDCGRYADRVYQASTRGHHHTGGNSHQCSVKRGEDAISVSGRHVHIHVLESSPALCAKEVLSRAQTWFNGSRNWAFGCSALE